MLSASREMMRRNPLCDTRVSVSPLKLFVYGSLASSQSVLFRHFPEALPPKRRILNRLGQRSPLRSDGTSVSVFDKYARIW